MASFDTAREGPARPNSRTPVRPRRLGSSTRMSKIGAAEANWLVCLATSEVGRNKSPLLSKSPAARSPNRNEPIGLWLQLLLKSVPRPPGQFRRRGLYDGQNRVISARKGLFEVNFALSPVQIGRYQLRNIGIDGKVPLGVDARCRSQSQASHEDQPCMARAETNKRYNSPCQHRFSFYFWLPAWGKGNCRGGRRLTY